MRADARGAPGDAFDVALGAKLLERLDDRAARYAQVDSEAARGRQTRSARQSTVQNLPAQVVVDPTMERNGGVRIEIDENERAAAQPHPVPRL